MTKQNKTYTILPFNFQRFGEDVLLVGIAGDYIYLTSDEFKNLVEYNLSADSDLYLNLKSKNFISDSKTELTNAVDMLATRYRTKKGFLREFTTLHMMVITVRCNQKCRYCQASCETENAIEYDMKPETAKRIVDFIFQTPSNFIKIEFQGGEPLLNWDTIVQTVLYAEEKKKTINKEVEFVICTNITTDIKNKLDFIKEHKIQISTSLDGNKDIHNSCRLYRGGEGTYDKFISNLNLCKEVLGDESIGALMTTTSYSLKHIKDIIDEYRKQGFNGIFLRAINPYGFAEENKLELGYSIDKFVDMYKEALNYIIEINKKGAFFVEYYTTLLLKRILTPFPTGFVDLQSPSGAGICGVIYDYNGDVYPADEGRMLAKMGDKHFLMGNVHKNTYKEVFKCDLLKDIVNKSCLEVMPRCSQCVFSAFCGADPVRNYLETKDIVGDRLKSPFCEKNKAIFEYIFKLLKENDKETMDVFWSWITRRNIQEMNDENY